MKNKILLIALMMLTSMIASTMNRWVVVSDIHVLAPSLHDDGTASVHMAAGEMKLPLQSTTLLRIIADSIISMGADGVIITGDLTHNGERESHLAVIEQLERLNAHGIRALVIPGNHDINNPHAVRYAGDGTEPTATVTATEFAGLYSQFGYTNERDSASLSYVAQLAPGVSLLAIDSNLYSDGRYHSDGAVSPSTLRWVEDQARRTTARGDRVLAAMHHHVVEHFDGEARFMPNYIVADHDDVAARLAAAGVQHVLTGHLHITDAAGDGTITDIATGSAITYPFPMRILDITGDSVKVTTAFLDVSDNLRQAGRRQLEHGTDVLANMVARRAWQRVTAHMSRVTAMLAMQGIDTSRLPSNESELAALVLRHLREPLQQGLFAVCAGGETTAGAESIRDNLSHGLESLIHEILPELPDELMPEIIGALMARLEPMLSSALEDINNVGTARESRTHDHVLTIR